MSRIERREPSAEELAVWEAARLPDGTPVPLPTNAQPYIYDEYDATDQLVRSWVVWEPSA